MLTREVRRFVCHFENEVTCDTTNRWRTGTNAMRRLLRILKTLCDVHGFVFFLKHNTGMESEKAEKNSRNIAKLQGNSGRREEPQKDGRRSTERYWDRRTLCKRN